MGTVKDIFSVRRKRLIIRRHGFWLREGTMKEYRSEGLKRERQGNRINSGSEGKRKEI